jgi:S-DNA-T family DNA segregation ATPase FtsK/SpoIIIE
MAKSPQQPRPAWLTWLTELRENFPVELLGLGIFLLGGLFLLSLLPNNDPYEQGLPWLSTMVGWTAPLVALTLLILGAVLMLGNRAGYWSVEAIVGIELGLLALQTATLLVNQATPAWDHQLDGAHGGLVGATLGNLLLVGLGRWPALTFTLLMGGVGLFLLIRYTPLYYLYAALGQLLPAVGNLRKSMPIFPSGAPSAQPTIPSPHTPKTMGNFVAPGQANHPPITATSTLVRPAERKGETAPGLITPTQDNGTALPLKPTTAQSPQRSTKPAKTANKTRDGLPPVPAGSGALPTVDILTPDGDAKQPTDMVALQQLIEVTLADFNVPVRTIHMESGPTVTQFGVEPLYLERAGQKRKVRVSRIVSLADDLALALAVPAVRIEAPVPGRPYVGIEVPNPEKSMVSIRGVLESKTMQQGGKLALPLGRNTAGEPVVMDLTRAPHLLIAGATGAGKSVCINAIVCGLLMQHGPASLRFVMVDPKMVELPGYNGIPHLLGKVITEVDQVMGALTWLLLQMDDRYRLFQQHGVRNLDGYNALARKAKKGSNALQPLPYLVLIIDELADLMMTAAEDVERQICRLAQMARATGIHLILATQRPSIDVVTGLIKANFPSRIAFAVTSQVDSRVILDTPGAERLLGRGDMLVMRPDLAKLLRVQGCFVADEEIARVVNFWKSQADAPLASVTPPWAGMMERLDDADELLQEAIDAVRGQSSVTTSFLQRKLRVGYPKAGKLMEQLEAKGIIGPDQGGGQGRLVLLKNEDEGDGSQLDGETGRQADKETR